MKPLRRYAVLLALTAAAMAGPAAAAHADGATDTAPAPVTETEDDTAWGTPPADDEPADEGSDAATTRDTAWG